MTKKIAKTTSKKSIKKTTSSSPQTMEELLKSVNYRFKGLKRGQKVEGIITSISKKSILIDIGAKTEGIVLLDKEDKEDLSFIEDFKVGDKVKAVVFSPENEKGQILLSIRQTLLDKKWEFFEECLKTGKPVEVRGLEINKGGLIARLKGVRGFVPASQFSQQYLGKIEELQNKLFWVKIIEVNRQKNRLIFSEKEVSEPKVLSEAKKALKKIKIGDVYEGIVSGVMPFGVFVRVKTSVQKSKTDKKPAKKEVFLEGLVHISEVSWERVTDLNKIYKIGDKMKVKVLSIDEKTARLNLSIKQLTPDPWLILAKKYPPEKKIKGKVTRLTAYGAFVELEPGLEGLVHISKIPADYQIEKGKELEVYIESIDPEKHRISLGLVLKEKPVGYR